MSNIRNLQIKTTHKITKAAATTIGGRVPPGMKRYVTFLMVDDYGDANMTQLGVFFASATVSNMGRASIVSAGSHRKILIKSYGSDVSAAGTVRPVMFPASGPNPANPIFTIAGGSWLGVYSSKNTAAIFMQYFDE